MDKNRFSSLRRSIRSIWLKEYDYFRANHPFFILIFIATFLIFYNLGWLYLSFDDTSSTLVNRVRVFDNLRLTKQNFVKIMICVPTDVVDYRFSTVLEAIDVTRLEIPGLTFTKNDHEAKRMLKQGTVDIVVNFNELIETGKRIRYSINSRIGDLNVDYCVNCDYERKRAWGNAIEAQHATNRFLYWVIKGRGRPDKTPHWQLSHMFVEDVDIELPKRQTDFFLIFFILLPLCSRLIDSWNDDRESGFYKMFFELGARRYQYLFAKYQFWYAIVLFTTLFVFGVNYAFLPDTFPTTYVPFLVIYTADIVAFTVFLATVFNGCTIVAKIVGFLILTVGHFGFGTVFHGIVFFQLSVRYFGHPTVDTEWIDTIALGCMAANFILLILITVYLDAYIFSYTLEPLVYYYPLQQSYWFPKRRDPIIDTEADKQYLFGKEEPAEKPATGIMAVLCGVCKRVGNNWVLNKLSLTIRSGEIVTLYGHRGCGGQVILSILSGQETPEHGSVQYQNTLRKLVVSVASEVPTLGYLTVAKYLNMISDIRGVHLSESVLASILQDLGLINVQSTRLNLLSTTQRERVRVGAAFVGHPDLVLIDWPTKESLQCYKFQILRFIERMKMDKAIVITSYDAQGTEAISDQIMLLSDGYMVLCGARAPYLDSISSVFELRLWPLTGFSSEEIEEIMVVLARCDQKMKEAARLFETPNGKLRIILPIAYRERIIVCIRELEQKAIQLGIAFCEMGSPSLHDIYANACFNEKQYTMLADFDKFNSFHNKKEFNNPNWYYSKNLLRAVCAGGFLCQVVLALAFFLIFALFIFFSLQKTLYTEARLISFDAIPSDVTIHCNNCYQEDALNVKYEAVGIETDLQENTAWIASQNFDGDNYTDVIAASRGSGMFTMVMQNFGFSQIVHELTGHYPYISPTLECPDFRNSRTENGFSLVFTDVSKYQLSKIIAESQTLMFFLGMCQSFVFVISMIFPYRLLRANMAPNNIFIPWPRYVYFSLIFIVNTFIFLIISIVFLYALTLMDFFAMAQLDSVIHLLSCWLAVYASTVPLIYALFFSLNNASAIFPTIVIVSTLLVNIPTTFLILSERTMLQLDTVLHFMSWAIMLSPPTALQVLAAFLNAGRFHVDNQKTIMTLTLCCVVHLWILALFAIFLFQPGFNRAHEAWFKFTTQIGSHFDRGTTIFPGAAVKNAMLLGRTDTTSDRGIQPEVNVNAIGSSETPEKRPAGGKEPTVPKANKAAAPAPTAAPTAAPAVKAGLKIGPTTRPKPVPTPVTSPASSTAPSPVPAPAPAPPPVPKKLPVQPAPIKPPAPAKPSAPIEKKKLVKTESIILANPIVKPAETPVEPAKNQPKGEPKVVESIPVSLMTCYEERLVEKAVTMKSWDTKQSIPINNSSVYLLGDQASIKSALMKTVVEMNPSNQVAYVPVGECLPTVYTPRELFINVALCHGVNISDDYIDYLLGVFDMTSVANLPMWKLCDTDRRILTFLCKLAMKPTVLIFDQLDSYLPHTKMMTVWSLCARLHSGGVGVIFSSFSNTLAEDTATSCAHMHKATFFAAEAPSSLKAERRWLMVDNVPAHAEQDVLSKVQTSNEVVILPTVGDRRSIRFQGDDFPTLETVIEVVNLLQKSLITSSIRSISFDEYIECAFGIIAKPSSSTATSPVPNAKSL